MHGGKEAHASRRPARAFREPRTARRPALPKEARHGRRGEANGVQDRPAPMSARRSPYIVSRYRSTAKGQVRQGRGGFPSKRLAAVPVRFFRRAAGQGRTPFSPWRCCARFCSAAGRGRWRWRVPRYAAPPASPAVRIGGGYNYNAGLRAARLSAPRGRARCAPAARSTPAAYASAYAH